MKKLLSFILLLSSFSTYSQTLEQDRLALVAFFNAADGERWFFQQRPSDYPVWQVPGNPGDSPCGWYGVECENNRVVSLTLAAEDLSGTIPKEIGNLTALKSLIIPGGGVLEGQRPSLYGTLPAEFANLVNLETLDLRKNFFDQVNSDIIFDLPNLKSLSFSATWPIPDEIGDLSNLETLVIDNEYVNSYKANLGDFPIGICRLPKLTSLSVSGTHFQSAIPNEIGQITSLTSVFLNGAADIGTIPPGIGNLSNLTSLQIIDLPGGSVIPDEIGNLINLRTLNLTLLLNSGAIPSSIGNLVNLEQLTLSGNGHTGTIPSSFNQLTKVSSLSLINNHLTGPIPDLSAVGFRKIVVSVNDFTFDGIESNETRFAYYSNQKKIPVTKRNGILSVNAGGTLSKNTYKWYNFGSLVETKVGDSTFTPAETGNYHVEVTNSVATGLTLISENVESSLPVTLIYFKGKQEKASNVISWKTASETGNKGFEIEKSSDSRTFESVGFIDGGGDSREDRSYHYTDLNPFRITYYRLKQLDYDGRSDYSKIIMVKNEPELSVYPNPARDYITVSGLSKHEELSIFNMRGELVLKQQTGISKPVNISGLPVGVYTLKIGDRTKNMAISK
ncbi:T9SS type A sorting domain-containing protein [Dyadobacter sp. Leaf189]|uniref:T9SS type A sorting domain-containing protein n=1 Tax=Dyadobacter sp. Leaf189 TaxID=1736295 RepID=UPI0006FAE7FD|nr:T9SS type A sorting domain-containing protein [Dyadobacter sp. Leaf189]KQS33293.1 hypothetical protein ASG33_04210 [Dyadobacter sp. Leaf189]